MEDDVVVIVIVVLDNVVVLVVVLVDVVVVLIVVVVDGSVVTIVVLIVVGVDVMDVELRFRFNLFSELPSFSPSDLFGS